jgi:signal peptidase I
MRPTLEAGDYVVVKAIDFQKLQPGMMVNYQARWLRPTSPTAVHWCVRKYGDEWVMDGENNKNYENTKETMMGKKEFRGIVVAIYTTRPSP